MRVMNSYNKTITYSITIIIPVHNIEKYLEQTLNSLLNQSIGYENLEVIMVNDCSTDGSGKIIDKYARKYENFVAIHLPENNGLPGKPRNIGIERATGEYLMFMDHDDYYSDDACEVFYNRITNENADVLFSRYNYIFDGGQVKQSFNHFEELNEISLNSVDENKELFKIAPSIWTKLFKRSFILENDIRFPEGMLAEDLSFVVHAFLKAHGIIYLNNYFGYNYRIRNSEGEKSTIHIRNKKYLLAMINGYYHTYNIIKDQKKEEYFPIIFEGNLQYWMGSFILSDTKPSEKLELLEMIAPLFEKQKEHGFNLDKIYLPLFNDISNKEFNRAILISEMMENFKKIEIESKKNQENLQKQLKVKERQVAELQSTGGWLRYKTRNISHRLKKKIMNK